MLEGRVHSAVLFYNECFKSCHFSESDARLLHPRGFRSLINPAEAIDPALFFTNEQRGTLLVAELANQFDRISKGDALHDEITLALKARIGWDDNQTKTIAQIAELLNRSRMTANLRWIRGLRIMRQPSRSKVLKALTEDNWEEVNLGYWV